jgi:hypothetical protein
VVNSMLILESYVHVVRIDLTANLPFAQERGARDNQARGITYGCLQLLWSQSQV